MSLLDDAQRAAFDRERRWTLILCYNAARNDPCIEHHHPRYTPLRMVPDSALEQAQLRLSAPGDKATFLRKAGRRAQIESAANGNPD